MNVAEALELVITVLHDLNARVYMLEADSEGRGDDRMCNDLLQQLDGISPPEQES